MAIPSKEYWALRAIQREEETFARGAELSMRLYNAYQQAVREMRRAVNDFYVRYARENKLTYEEAVRALNRAEAREWKATLGEWVERIRAEPDPRIREKLTAELDALSYRSRMDRLDALTAQARMTMDELYARSMREMAEEFGEVYRESFYKKSFDLQSRAGRYRPIAKFDAAMIENVMSYPWSGANFSDRLWQNKEALLFNIRQDLTQGLIRGTGLPALSRDLAARMGQSYKVAERLVRTEVNHFHNEADKAAYRAAGVEWYEFMATLDARTCAVCGALDGKHFKLSEARTGENYPPMHPNDRCTTVEWDPEGEADWSKSGKPMPEGMTYEEWRKKQFTGEQKTGIMKQGDDGMGVEIKIDQFTPCLMDTKTGELVDTAFSSASPKELRKVKGWGFDWTDKALSQDEIYKLTLAGDSEIQGLVAMRRMDRDQAVYVHIAESAPHNLGPDKHYSGVGGHLFAIAARQSVEAGYGGYFFMDAKNLDLVKHYQETLGAQWLGMPHEYRMIVDEDAAARLLDIYTFEEGAQ